MFNSSYFSDYNSSRKLRHNMYSSNARGQKNIKISRVKKLNCDADMIDNSNSKCHNVNVFSNHMSE